MTRPWLRFLVAGLFALLAGGSSVASASILRLDACHQAHAGPRCFPQVLCHLILSHLPGLIADVQETEVIDLA